MAINLVPISIPPIRHQSFVFMLLLVIVLSLLAFRSLADLNVAFMSYYNDFIEPSYILGRNWSTMTVVAQQSIIQWADWLAAQGPWCTRFLLFFNKIIVS
jgi:hypothetical protein